MKTAVIYWSSTGNTEAMAKAIAEAAGAELFAVSEFSGKISDYDRVAFGCSAMGAEELDDSEFEPFFASVEGELSGKKIALFGSYGWGDGEWMRNWAERAKTDGAEIIGGEGLIINETPDADGLAKCAELGKALAN
ncbi:flavodoxin, short chain [Ruminococcaceae bacterium FB2012]|nr:flavodoxin, short chain [Ruminococcaceae bacterium FB2012]